MEGSKLQKEIEQFQKLFNSAGQGQGTGFYFSYRADLSFNQQRFHAHE